MIIRPLDTTQRPGLAGFTQNLETNSDRDVGRELLSRAPEL